jgi:endonuclease/exonuclease/phosphatase family metal-dependent hydrolase
MNEKPPGLYYLKDMSAFVRQNPDMESMGEVGHWKCSSDHLPHAVRIQLHTGEYLSVMTWNLLSDSLMEHISTQTNENQLMYNESFAKVPSKRRYHHQIVIIRTFQQEAEARGDRWIVALQEVDSAMLSKMSEGVMLTELHNKVRNFYRCVLIDRHLAIEQLSQQFNYLSHYLVTLPSNFSFVLGNYHLPFGITETSFKDFKKYENLPLLLCGDFNSMFQPKSEETTARDWSQMLELLTYHDKRRKFFFTKPFWGSTHINHLKNVQECESNLRVKRRFDCFDQILVSGLPVVKVETVALKNSTNRNWARGRR